ncbi:MAG: SGNH/GDSL hydrolase family protein, partial [Vicinamibacteria bacterium]
MTRFRGSPPVLALLALSTLVGLLLLEGGARMVAVREDRKQGRLDRDLRSAANPKPGSTVTLGQIIRRSDSPRIIYELRPRLDVRFAGGHLTSSDAGYRGGDTERPKPPGRYRVIGIGDSYMFGQGVSDEETYLARLPGAMASSAVGRTLDTVNLSAPGYNTVMEVELLKASWARLDGDLILIEIVGNDLDLPNFLWKTVDPWTPRRSFLLDFIRQRLSPTVHDENVAGLSEAPLAPSTGNGTFSRDAEHVPPNYASMVGLAS